MKIRAKITEPISGLQDGDMGYIISFVNTDNFRVRAVFSSDGGIVTTVPLSFLDTANVLVGKNKNWDKVLVDRENTKYETCQYCNCEDPKKLVGIKGTVRTPSLVITVCDDCIGVISDKLKLIQNER